MSPLARREARQGLSVHLALDHRLPGVHGPADARHDRLHLPEPDPCPGRARPLRRPGQLRPIAGRHAGLGVPRQHLPVRRHLAARGRPRPVRRRTRAQQQIYVRFAAHADLLVPAVRGAVRRRRADLEPDAEPEKAGSTRRSDSSAGRLHPTGCTTRPPSTRASSSSASGASGPGSSSTSSACGASRRSCTTRRGSTAQAGGHSCAT